MEAEIGVMCLSGKKCQGLLATTRSWEGGREQILHQASRRNQPCRHLDFGVLTSGVDFCYFKPLPLPPPKFLVISFSSYRKLIQSIKPYKLGVKVKPQTQINLRLLKNPN